MSLFNLALVAFQLLVVAGFIALIPLMVIDIIEWGKE
jgi:hypothetical protein